MKNLFRIEDYRKPAPAEKERAVHPEVDAYRAMTRSHLSYFARSARESGMPTETIREDLRVQKRQLGQRISLLQELIDGGMAPHEARRFTEQQHGEDHGFVPDPESVEGMLYADRKRTAERILQRDEEAPTVRRIAA